MQRLANSAEFAARRPSIPLEDLIDFLYIKILAARGQFRTTSEGMIEE
jgi:hypothetical protein